MNGKNSKYHIDIEIPLYEITGGIELLHEFGASFLAEARASIDKQIDRKKVQEDGIVY